MLPAFLVLTLAAAETLHIVPAPDARFALEIEKTGLMRGKKHVFLFERYKGTVLYDRDQPENSRVSLTIESASAVCTDTWVSDKDRSKIQEYALHDMLAVEKHREITFSSTRVISKEPDRFEVQGSLTIRGIAKPLTVEVSRKPGGIFEGSSQFKMTDYGLKPPSAALGLIGTKDLMTVSFHLRAQ